MGCGASASTKQQPTNQQQKHQNRNNNNRKSKSSPQKNDFIGVKSIDLTEDESDYEQTYRSRTDTNKYPNGVASMYGFKAKLKQRLIQCTEKGSLEKLEDALAIYDKYDCPEDDDYFRALDRRQFLTLQRGLRDGIRRRHAGTLDDAVCRAKESVYHKKLRSHIAAAEKLRDHLYELEIHTHDVLDMEQKTVSEVKSYQRPPDCIFYTMKATYVLLGTPGEKMQDWGDVQALLNQTNKNSIIYKIDHFDLDEAKLENAESAEKILNKTEYGDVLKASNGAAIFYLWTNQNIQQIYEDNKNKSNNNNKRKKR